MPDKEINGVRQGMYYNWIHATRHKLEDVPSLLTLRDVILEWSNLKRALSIYWIPNLYQTPLYKTQQNASMAPCSSMELTAQ